LSLTGSLLLAPPALRPPRGRPRLRGRRSPPRRRRVVLFRM